MVAAVAAVRIPTAELRGEIIPEGCRNNTLASVAGRWRWAGYERPAIANGLCRVNRKRCAPPLPDREVCAVAASISRKPAGGAGASVVPRAEYDAARGEILQLIELALRWRWRGRTATSKRAVLLALLAVAYRSGRVRVAASERKAAEDAGLSRPTVARALAELVRTGWLVRIPQHYNFANPDECAPGTVWAIKRPRRIDAADVLPRDVSAEVFELVLRDDAADVWRNVTGLGHTAERVYSALDAHTARSHRTLADTLGMNRRTVVRALWRLEHHELAAHGGGVWRRTDRSPDDVGKTLRSHGALERQRTQHARERESFERMRLHFAHLRTGQTFTTKTIFITGVCTSAQHGGARGHGGRGEVQAHAPPKGAMGVACGQEGGVSRGEPVEKSRAAPVVQRVQIAQPDANGWAELAGESDDDRTNRRRQFLRAQAAAWA